MNPEYSKVKLDIEEVIEIVKNIYNLEGNLTPLNGEIDFNFKLQTKNNSFLLKISRPNSDLGNAEFQTELLSFLYSTSSNIVLPEIIPDIEENKISFIRDSNGQERFVRLLNWIDGRLYSQVNPKNDKLLYSLGEEAGKITKTLLNFDHPFAHRNYEWDIANVEWTKDHIHLFNSDQQNLVNYFLELFSSLKAKYNNLRKTIVHNDVNDNNIIVSADLINPSVVSIIDYGDAVYTHTINDLAICISYGVMNKPDLLSSASQLIKGYNNSFSLEEIELNFLYVLVAMRLIISVTKSAINKKKEPENKYLQISEKPAWDVLCKLKEINPKLALYTFREACGFKPHPHESEFKSWSAENSAIISELFPSLKFDSICSVDMSVSSTFIGNESDYNNNDRLSLKLKSLELENPKSLIAGGYLETRPIYTTEAYKKEGNNGPEYRSTHLGVDFWVEPFTPIHSIMDGVVFSVNDNSKDKDYGPTIILEHKVTEDFSFFTLYGHLSKSSLSVLTAGQSILKGDLIGYVGTSDENGNWAPHLHFQIMLDMLGNIKDFPGVVFQEEINIWKSICPDPNLLFKNSALKTKITKSHSEILSERQTFLGRSLSISYKSPLHIVRGNGQYLIDSNGRKYLDTVNNVAHVGHEHPEVVRAGQEQMAVLNTNTRYLHENITEFAKELLSTFPKELCVVHFVNSGSEANELSLRMAKATTNQKDIIAVEVGYHGNTSGCVDISSYKFDGKGGKGAPEFTHIVPLPDSYRGLYTGDNTGAQYASHISKQLDHIKSKGRNIAAFICESIISCGGQIELPKDYLTFVYESVRKAGGVCIADEVQVGCGRVGSAFWGFELHNVIPDIVTIGKPIGNGHPVAAVVCTKEIAEAFNNGMEYFNTFGGNPVSSAIGSKVLEIMKSEKLQVNALNVGTYLKGELKTLQTLFPIIGNVRGQGLFLGFELADKNKNPESEKATYLANRMREFGILMSTDGKDNNVIKIKPPMVFTKENADELVYRLTQVLKEDFMRLNNE
jgi:4-aminobutyrate aminotransferase-like enzyme/Ser/Thr protein kinase RdoA (MazF antagonist)